MKMGDSASGWPTDVSASDPNALERARWRAWHRGMRELDLLLGPYADARLAEAGEGGLCLFEALLEVPDPIVLDWIVAGAPAEPRFAALVADIVSFATAAHRDARDHRPA